MSGLANYTNAIFLIREDCRAMKGIFEADAAEDKPTAKRELFKTFDKTIKAGDLVNVTTHTRHKVSVVKIVEADCPVDFLQANEDTRWIISKVDLTAQENLTQMEADAIAAIKAAELRKQRDDLKKTMMADHVATINELPIATAPSSLPPPKP